MILFVYLRNRNWMYNRMLICASCFAGVTLLVALYIYVSAAWAKYSAQQRKEREERRQMELKERENQRKRRIYGVREKFFRKMGLFNHIQTVSKGSRVPTRVRCSIGFKSVEYGDQFRTGIPLFASHCSVILPV